MKKLNNKGITTVEVIICFVIVVIITISLYTSVSSFNEKRMIEGYKEQIYIYKNSLTKEIQDDFIKIGLSTVSKKIEVDADNKTIYTLDCTLKDGTTRTLRVIQRIGYSSYHLNGYKDQDDYFMIEYGPSDDLIEHPLPELGETLVEADSSKGISEHIVKDLSINNVLIDIKDNNVLSIYIGFYYPELSTRYSISINVPVNYISSGAEGIKIWDFE